MAGCQPAANELHSGCADGHASASQEVGTIWQACDNGRERERHVLLLG